ncbi:hypothetical protein FQV27_01455 [Paracoccus aurantiacus]|uniref:Uncharacterized protein n=1 Tax=Paracoccus aurantiacus TaxID=2599412 RepID=A0A5C6S7Y5_9RHOB|nr:hypothetical protein [Paracoccus aurantiacus]TXB70566.1 hypothetical protein FQV27_01455 [Paracoccus aurantiacus]
MNSMSGIGWDLLGTLAVGVGAAALLFAALHAARAAGRPLPRWLLPAGIGISMIAFATWNEYSWAGRVRAQLPERVAVVAEGSTTSALRPWTYLSAPTSRLALIDPEAVRDDADGIRVAPVMLVQRWKRSMTVEQGVDCTDRRIRPPDGDWQPAPEGDPTIAAVCKGG